ncbi:MAG: FtsH protease activity modulator HflK [Gammaproteobacteria bacterium]|nr:FtsH protease activity modulator HflK [Gammaproteobacteria bacterium]MBU2477602.1 FtsH protease activity modulator HflK [Gammaproteobacteria bacterium]
MAWNEPGGNKDPWGGRGGDQGPPDLDEIVRKMQDKMGGLFGGRKGGGGRSGGNGGGFLPIGVIAVVGVVVWLLFGLYIVEEGKRGVELRFGQFTMITMPGLHWHAPYPIEQVELVDVEQRRFVEVGYRSAVGGGSVGQQTVPREALMLTQDENIVDIRVAVQYQVKDAREYLFNVRDPDATLKQATESAIREVIGKSKMDFVLTEGRAEVAIQVKTLIQSTLDIYNAGLLITTVNLQDAQPPEEVQGAFVDAIKAREDEERQKQEAQAYSNDIIPKARGAAARVLEEATGYKLSVIAKAEGEASRFSQMLTEYAKAPEVTRKRLYLDTMETVLANSNKVTVDVSKGNNLLYLPLDQMLQGAAAAAPRAFAGSVGENATATSGNDNRTDSRRSREPR